jgi:error-prone DNA polymerase
VWRTYAGRKAISGLPIPDEYTPSQKIAHEAEAFGFMVSCHPLRLYQAQVTALRPLPGSDMAAYIGHRVTMIGWLITEKFAETKGGLPMEFATFEDETALYDATIFPEVYRRCCHLLALDRPYVLQGVIEVSFGVVTLTVTDLQAVGLNQETRPGHSWDEWDGGRVVC